jgi:acetyl/propionyl-CoA carboxylase alpha subunit
VTHFYDPLLAKLIVHAENRENAIQRMQVALRDFVVHGVVTNIDFMQFVLNHADFSRGKVSTMWVERTLESNGLLFDAQHHPPALQNLIAAALADVVFVGTKVQSAVSNEIDPFSPWKHMNNYRVNEK